MKIINPEFLVHVPRRGKVGQKEIMLKIFKNKQFFTTGHQGYIITMITEFLTKIVKFINPGLLVDVPGRGHFGHIEQMYKISKTSSLLLNIIKIHHLRVLG